ncbi:MAG: hypothetical protein V4694_05810 [Pseudomonadota bacterium]
MSDIVSFFLIISLIIITVRFFIAQNSYEKILSFYFIFTNIIILILVNSIANFDAILDIVIILFLLKLVAVLFLLFNRKKI